MLDHFLQVAYTHDKKTEESVKLARLLKELPMEDLKKLASGECKLSFGECNDWIDKYKGTPLFDQALSLEKADIEAEVARNQAMAAAPSWDTMNKTQDQIRVQKKMLDLELLQLQNGTTSGAQQPMDVVPADAQGAGAPGDAGSSEMPEKAAQVKTALSSGAISRALTGAVERGALSPARAAKAEGLGKKLMNKGVQMAGGFGSGKTTAGPGMSLIRQGSALKDYAGKVKGAALDVNTISDLGKKGLDWVRKNPARAGALAGAGVGAAGGALAGGKEHRLSGALGGAALGAGLGHAAGGIGSGLARGKSLGESTERYTKVVGRKLGLKGKPAGVSASASAPAVSTAAPTVAAAAPGPESLPSELLQSVRPPTLPAHRQVGPLPPAVSPPTMREMASEVTPSMVMTDRMPPPLPKKPQAPLPYRGPIEPVPMTMRSPEVAKAAMAMRFSYAALQLPH